MIITQLSPAYRCRGVAPAESGDWNHNSSQVITGPGFGTKSTPAPVVWDDCSGTVITDLWDGAVPSACTDSNFNMAYRAVHRGIALPPNSRGTKYMAGCHGESGGFDAGLDCMFWKTRNHTSYPFYIYVSYYQRSDDNWVFGLGSPGDNNYKTGDYSSGTAPYTPPNWYDEYNTAPSSTSSTPEWHGNLLPDGDSSNWWWDPGTNPMSGVWTKIEKLYTLSDTTAGNFKLWDNGVLKANYTGTTDGFSGTPRTLSIGGYTRGYGNSNQWRYFKDIYLDYSRARVVLANNATLASATIIEPQIPTAWSDSSITVDVNCGQFAQGATAHLHVIDSSAASQYIGTKTIGT
jgi:hypothetical protein